MAQESYAYDHPEYQLSLAYSGNIAAGSGNSSRFTAFTSMAIKSILIRPLVLSTSNDIINMYQILASGGTTNTFNAGTLGSAGAGNIRLTGSATSSLYAGTAIFWMAAGDDITITKGTDATVTMVYAVEYTILPGASVESL